MVRSPGAMTKRPPTKLGRHGCAAREQDRHRHRRRLGNRGGERQALRVEGAAVVVADIRAHKAQETVDAISEAGGHAVAVEVDVADAGSVAAMIDAASHHFGGLDVLFNNAGTLRPGTAVELSVDDWDLVMAVNVRSVFLGAKYAVPLMEAQRRRLDHQHRVGVGPARRRRRRGLRGEQGRSHQPDAGAVDRPRSRRHPRSTPSVPAPSRRRPCNA